jgi:hypothetical protein
MEGKLNSTTGLLDGRRYLTSSRDSAYNMEVPILVSIRLSVSRLPQRTSSSGPRMGLNGEAARALDTLLREVIAAVSTSCRLTDCSCISVPLDRGMPQFAGERLMSKWQAFSILE